MIIQKVWNRVKVNYFSGSLQITYKADTFKTWEEIVQDFKNDLQNPKPKYTDDLIAFSSKSITIKREKKSVFRWPSDVFYLMADIRVEDHSLIVGINVTLGEYNNAFMTFWRGAVFVSTVIAIAALVLTVRNDLQVRALIPAGCVLFILNLSCWLYTYYFRYNSDSLFKNVQKTVEGK